MKGMPGATSTPSKFLAWQTPWGRHQLRHKTSIARAKIQVAPIETEVAIARAAEIQVAAIEAANLRSNVLERRLEEYQEAGKAYKRKDSRLEVRKNEDGGARER